MDSQLSLPGLNVHIIEMGSLDFLSSQAFSVLNFWDCCPSDLLDLQCSEAEFEEGKTLSLSFQGSLGRRLVVGEAGRHCAAMGPLGA